MMKRLDSISVTTVIVVVMALTFDQGYGQVPYEWVPDNFPHPLKQPGKCGLGEKGGYVCDPNGLLTKHQLTTLNWFLEGIAETVNPEECPCSWYHCEKNQGHRFFTVAIALIPKLSIPRNTDGQEVSVVDAANTFAYRLEHDVWNISSCEEDIVILYSRDDKALVTMTGKSAGRKMNAAARSAIHSIVGHSLASGHINEGMQRMVHEVEQVLNGQVSYDHIMMAQVGDSAPGLLASPVILLMTLLSLVSTCLP